MKENGKATINVDKWAQSMSRFFNGDIGLTKTAIEGLLESNPDMKRGDIFRELAGGKGRDIHNNITFEGQVAPGFFTTSRSTRRKKSS